MKKGFKMPILAATAVLALASSFISCQQAVTPAADKQTITGKDIYEQQLGTPSIKGESYFGMNVIEYSDVNYAENYVLYRFGPTGDFDTTEDNIKGKLITGAEEKFDGYVVEDKVSKTNPMIPGTYTYKLIAKSEIITKDPGKQGTNSARGPVELVGPNLSNVDKGPANQGYWANPKVDVLWLPSVTSTNVTVTKENMPPFGSQVPAPKALVENVDYYRSSVKGEENIFYFNPTLEVSEIYAVIDGLNESFENKLPNPNIVPDKKNMEYVVKAEKQDVATKYKLELPRFATKYKILARNTWTSGDTYYRPSKVVEVKNNINYQDNKAEVDLAITKNTTYTKEDTKEVSQNVFSWTVKTALKDKYTVVAQRAVLSKDTVTTTYKYFTKIEDVKLEKVAEVEDKAAGKVTFYYKDSTAKAGEKYYYIFGGKYGDNAKLKVYTFDDVEYVNVDAYLGVSELNATLTTPLPKENEFYRKDITGEIKFALADVGYTAVSLDRITQDGTNAKKVITRLTAPSVTKTNLGKTYVEFKDTLPWNSTKEYALVPTYKLVVSKGYTNYTIELEVTADTTNVENNIKIQDNYNQNKTSPENVIPVDVLKLSYTDNKTAEKAQVKDVMRNLYKINSFSVSNDSVTKPNSIAFKYTIGAEVANNPHNSTDISKLNFDADDKYFINYVIKESDTNQIWSKGEKAAVYGSDKVLEIGNLKANTKYSFEFTLIEKVNGKDVVVKNGSTDLTTNPVKIESLTTTAK